MSVFQYRTFNISQKQVKKFDQLDIYFYRFNSTTVGVKARFSHCLHQPFWNIKKLELKFIKNYDQIRQGKTIFEHWKKIVIETNFYLYSSQYMKSHLKEFIQKQGQNIDDAITNQLINLSKNISKILKESDIKEKHFNRNPELLKWLETESSIVDIFLVQKLKSKSFKEEEGFVRANLLYDKTKLNKSIVYITQAFQSEKQGKLNTILKEKFINLKQNIRYPTFIDKLYQNQQ